MATIPAVNSDCNGESGDMDDIENLRWAALCVVRDVLAGKDHVAWALDFTLRKRQVGDSVRALKRIATDPAETPERQARAEAGFNDIWRAALRPGRVHSYTEADWRAT